MNSRTHPDPAVRRARSLHAAAIRELDEEKAAQASRELVRARRAYRMRMDLEALTASGQRVDDEAKPVAS